MACAKWNYPLGDRPEFRHIARNSNMDRREFIERCALLCVTTHGLLQQPSLNSKTMMMDQLTIRKVSSDFEREKLRFPFGFKGAFLTELWQTVVLLEGDKGQYGVGLATQSVLYGDADVFASTSEANGNAWMFALSNRALTWLKDKTFENPVAALDDLLPWLYQEGKTLTGQDKLNINFVFNALVSVDNAMWMLYAKQKNLSTFHELIPAPYKSAFSHQNDKVAVMFQISYNMPLSDIEQAVEAGYFVFKLKTGSPGDQASMLKQDQARLKEIHDTINATLKRINSKKRMYYTMDANGRYEKKATLKAYLDYAEQIGAFDRILFYEEPFVEANTEHVGDLGVIVGADESVHNEQDALKKIKLGYKAFILKGIAKTLSQTIKIAKVAHDHQIPCLCSDLTVNPVLIEWNKIIAASLPPFPGLGMGLMETNGDMNYVAWEAMKQKHPFPEASWTQAHDGVFHLDASFFEKMGGMMTVSTHYKAFLGLKD